MYNVVIVSQQCGVKKPAKTQISKMLIIDFTILPFFIASILVC